MLLALALLACNPEPADTGEAPPFAPALATGGCGLAPYDWAPMDRMGEIVAWEHLPEGSFSAESIDILLQASGAGVITPVANGVDLYRVRYLTQDQGEVVEATGLLAWPDREGTYPTVAWLHPIMGFSDSCAPTAGGLEEFAGAILVASFGFAVAAPDYLGMAGWGEPSGRIHPYLVPEATAVASLDAVRALWRFQDGEGPTPRARGDRRLALWGASEGGFAALWADRYGNGYLPEADIVATVAAVPPSDVQGIAVAAVTVPGAATAGLAGFLTTSHLWYEGAAPLADVLTDEAPGFIASSIEESLVTDCGGGDVLDDITTIDQTYTDDFVASLLAQDWEAIEPWSCYLEQATLRNAIVPRGSDAPVLFQVSEDDELVVGYVERADAPRLCDAGYELEYLECAGANHVQGAADSLPYQLAWLRARFAGEPLGETCVIGEPVDCEQFLQ